MKQEEGRRPRSFAKGRPLCVAALTACLGILAGKAAGYMPLPMAACAVLGALLALVLRGMKRDMLPGVLITLFSLFMLWSAYAARPFDVPPGGVVAEGYVQGEAVRRSDGSYRVALRDTEAVDMLGRGMHLGKVYWTFRPYDDEEIDRLGQSLFDGDRVTFAGSVYTPRGQENPHGFDFALYLRQNGFDCAVSGCSSPSVVRGAGITLRGRILRLRLALSAKMEEIFGSAAAWPQALLLGERDKLSEDTRRAFSDLGIAHILAVSGLHVGLLGAVLLFLLRKASAPPRLRLAVLAVFLAFYCALLDFSRPVCRAGILLALGEGRHVLRRSADPLTALSAAALMMLGFSPLSLFLPGFRMTFCAVLGIVLLAGPIRRCLRFLPSEKLRDALGVSWGAALGVALPVAETYHVLAPAGLLLSPPVCLGMGLLLPAYLGIFAVGCVFPGAGQHLASLLHALLGPLPALFARWSGAGAGAFRVPSVHPAAVPLLGAAAFIVSGYALMRRKDRLRCAALCLAGALCLSAALRDTRVRYLQMSEGQADCALILDGHETVVIDCGEDGSDLASYLLSEGRRADTVVLTHLHSDHCGGLIALMEEGVPIGRVILPEGAEEVQIDEAGALAMAMLRERGIPLAEVRAGDVFSTARTRFEVLWPEKDAVRPLADANDYSMALLWEAGGVRVLFAGDLSGKYEMYAARDADILKVAHHGSNASTGEDFLRCVSPAAAVITCRSGAKLPGEETAARLAEMGCTVYRTDECGCLTFYPGECGVLAEMFLPQQ